MHFQADQQLVSKLRAELMAAKRELEALQGEAASSTALRDELASRWVLRACVELLLSW